MRIFYRVAKISNIVLGVLEILDILRGRIRGGGGGGALQAEDLNRATQAVSGGRKPFLFFSFFIYCKSATPPSEDYVQVDCVLKPRYKKCSEKELNKR